jgi:hypothetical protein
MNTQDLRNLLANYYGSETFYRHGLNRRMLYTEGAQAFAENANAYWFLDIVATELFALLKGEDFLTVILHVEGSKAKITADDGNGNVLFTKSIDYTDCPEGKWKFFFTGNVLMLPSEY